MLGFAISVGISVVEDSSSHLNGSSAKSRPYGKEIHLDEYGTVLLFATGIGIAGQLPYVRQLLENFHNYDAKARRIALFWQVDSEGRPQLIPGEPLLTATLKST